MYSILFVAMKRVLIVILSIVASLILIYLLGPRFPKPVLNNELPTINLQSSQVESFLSAKESILNIKPDNESRIVWVNDSVKNKTQGCLLYLHGFSASWFEGDPVHIDFAKRYGMNLYLPLLASHGLDTSEALLDMTPERLYESAKEALVVAHSLGEKVYLMGTSTGATLALKLAAEYPSLVDGLFLFSPNIAINNPAAFLLSKPWGLQIIRKVYKGNYRVTNEDFASTDCKYWNCKYRLEAVVYLQQLVEAIANKETFQKVNKPLFLAYYYKDQENQDEVVKVDAMQEMFQQVSTPEILKQEIALPEAGTHPIASKLFSGAWQQLEKETYRFAEEKMRLIPEKE